MNWISVNDKLPTIGQEVYFKVDGEGPVAGTYENERWCVLGKPMGHFGRGFQDNYNKLPCDADLWMPEEDFISQTNK